MANDGNSKDKTQEIELYSISFDEESGNAPGVTQLINPKLIAEKEAARRAKEAAVSPVSANSSAPKMVSNVSLTSLGVFYELQFEIEHGSFKYARMKPHGKARFEMWQERFYFQMKLDLKALEVQSNFQEFSKGKDSFQEDAFALTDASFVQIIRVDGDSQKIYVLLSSQSLGSKKEAVLQALSGKTSGAGSAGDDEFKIEMAS